jgi:hypothetical protein
MELSRKQSLRPKNGVESSNKEVTNLVEDPGGKKVTHGGE